MPSASRNGFVVLATAATLAGCASGAPAPRSCADDAGCPAGSRCVASACVANALPSPVVTVPSGLLETNVLVSFDGSGSGDADADDSIVSYAWAFRAVTAGCAPPAVAGTDAIATVRFACPGRWAVDLTVTDEMPASATTTREFDVVAYSGPALVAAGADVALEHACTSLPTRCAPEGELVLSAAAPGFAPGEVSFEWSVEPPANRPLDANRRVTFSPDAFGPSPAVTIETDGTAISGDWIFRVSVRDAAGLVGSAATRVSVGNRPPVVQKTIPAVHHRFSGGQFTAAGEVPFSVTDPDGDALVGPSVEFRHAGDGDGAAFSGALAAAPPRVTFQIAVPYARPEDALHLIDGPGLERTIAFTVSDVNGGQASELWPIAVANRPPVLVSVPAAFTVDHVYDPVAAAYLAEAPLSTWSDPDGDPLVQVPTIANGDPQCAEIRVADGEGERLATASCRLAFSGSPAVLNFAGVHTVAHAVQDPWAPAAQTSAVTFTIANRPPQLSAPATPVVNGSCGLCAGNCGIPGEPMDAYCFDAVTVPISSGASDPDGDPLQVVAPPSGGLSVPQPLVCATAGCVLAVRVASIPATCMSTRTVGPLPYAVSDGLATATASLSVRRECL